MSVSHKAVWTSHNVATYKGVEVDQNGELECPELHTELQQALFDENEQDIEWLEFTPEDITED